MAERLPFGQLTPSARPIGAFINPSQTNTARPAEPQRVDTSVRIDTIQRGSGGNVQGFNQAQQLADALGPFNRALTQTLTQGAVALKSNQIEQGYYDELKNQQARATMSLQLQQEAGAANASAQISQLQKIDPTGAELLKEANPWKAIGQNRARAQLAGSEINNVLNADIAQNGGYLGGLAPGSGELMKRKAMLTQGVLDRYGLTGDEPETQFYVTPKLNQAWDQYTAQHSKLYSETVYENTVLATSALGVAGIQDAVQNGFKMPDGSTLQPGTPEWAAEGHRRLTGMLDGQLRLLPADKKAKAMENLRQDFMAFSGAPYVWDLITGIRVGDPSVEYDKRPTWGAAQASELLEDRQKAASRRLDEANNEQAFKKLDAQNAWNAGPGRFAPGTPEATEAILKFREDQLAKGFLNVDDFIAGATKDREALQATLFPADPREAENFSTAVAALPANAWTDDPNALKNIQDAAWQIASKEATAEARNRKYSELMGDVEKAREAAGKAAKDVVPGAKTATLEDLDSPEVRAIRKAQGKGTGGGLGASVFQNASRGVSVAQSVAATGDRNLTAAAGQLERLYQAAMQNKINAWQASHPTQVLSPEARANLIAEAKQEVRKSDAYARIMTPLLGRAPAGTAAAVTSSVLDSGRYATNSQGQTFGQVPSQLRGVSRQNFQNLPDSTVKGYAIRPVVDGAAMRDELRRIGRGDAVSSELAALAKRAGVSPYRYLQEQLKFYPGLDDQEGSLRQMLQEKAGRQRTGQSISRAQLPSALPAAGGTGGLAMLPVGYNPLGPGSWLMSMIAPPVQAIQSLVYPGGGGGGAAQGIPYVNQRASMSGQGDRECFSAASTMIASAYLGRNVSLSSYNSVRGKYGDSTLVGPQVRALQQLGVKASVADNGSVDEVARLARSGKPVAIGLNHNGASGHWIVVTGVTANGDFIVNDPFGKLRQQRNGGWEARNSGSPNDTTGRGVVYGRAFLRSIFEDRGAGTGRIMRVDGSPRMTASSGNGSGGGGNWQGYMKRLSYLETRLRNIPNAQGSEGRGYFQAFNAFDADARAASGGISPRDSDYNRAAQAAWMWIEQRMPKAAAAIKAGRYDEADRLLRGTWPSLPGGSQAQSDQVQREARRYLGG